MRTTPILFQGTDNVHRAPERAPGQASEESASTRSADDTAGIIEQFDVLILRGRREGGVRADLSPEILRHSLLGALFASLKLVRPHAPGEGPTAAEVGVQVAAILVDGLPRTVGSGTRPVARASRSGGAVMSRMSNLPVL